MDVDTLGRAWSPFWYKWHESGTTPNSYTQALCSVHQILLGKCQLQTFSFIVSGDHLIIFGAHHIVSDAYLIVSGAHHIASGAHLIVSGAQHT